MSTEKILVNDTVRIRVKFVDTDPTTGEQVDIYPAAVNVRIYDSDNNQLISESAEESTPSVWYYDYTPTSADTYSVKFTGTLDSGNNVIVQQKLYVSSLEEEFKPTVILKTEEIIAFAPDVDPLYLDPESLIPYFPDASLLEIGEIIHNYSNEVKALYNLLDEEDGSNLSFTVLEYIKAATACELSRTYGFGGDDEVSVRLGDLSIMNRSMPRNKVTRDNATTWCQIAASFRKEILAGKVGPKGFQPKSLPGLSIYDSKLNDKIVYPSGRELYDPNGTTTSLNDDPMPKRGFKKYD
jgi:hypothetical protein